HRRTKLLHPRARDYPDLHPVPTRRSSDLPSSVSVANSASSSGTSLMLCSTSSPSLSPPTLGRPGGDAREPGRVGSGEVRLREELGRAEPVLDPRALVGDDELVGTGLLGELGDLRADEVGG